MKKVWLGLLICLSIFLWEDFHDTLASTWILMGSALGLSLSGGLLVAVLIQGLQRPDWWGLLEKLGSLWFILPSLIVILVLFQSFGPILGLKGAIVVLALGQFPIILKALVEGGAFYDRNLKDLAKVSGLSLFQRLRYLWIPGIVPVARQQIALHGSHGVWSFAVPLLVCSEKQRPLTATLYYLIFEQQNFLQGGLLMSYGVLMTLLVSYSHESGPLSCGRGFLKPIQESWDYARIGIGGGIVFLTLLPLGLYGFDLIDFLGRSFDQLTIPWQSLFISLTLGICIASTAVWVCLVLSIKTSKFTRFFISASLFLPRFFWAILLGGILIQFTFPMVFLVGIYGVVMIFMILPYGVSLVTLSITRILKDHGDLLDISHLSFYRQMRFFWLPQLTYEIKMVFFYGVALSLGDVTLYLCLAPMPYSTLSLDLYENLMMFNWPVAHVCSCLIMGLLWFVYPKGIDRAKN